MKAGETWMNSANAENRNAWKGTLGIIESCWAVCDTGGGQGLNYIYIINTGVLLQAWVTTF